MNKDFLEETAKKYIENYPNRLSDFLSKYEAKELHFAKEQLKYFESTIYDLENSESSEDGYSTTGYDNFFLASNVVKKISWKTFYYSTNSKIEFLESKIIQLSQPVVVGEVQNEKPLHQQDIDILETNYKTALLRMPNDMISKYLKAIIADRFFDIEIFLFNNNHIDSNRKWVSKKIDAAGFINKCSEYIRKDVSRVNLRAWFEKRYQIICSKEFQPNRLKDNIKQTYQFKPAFNQEN